MMGDPLEGAVVASECGAVLLGEDGRGLGGGPLCEGDVLAVQVLEEGVPLVWAGVFDGAQVDVLGGVFECGPAAGEVVFCLGH